MTISLRTTSYIAAGFVALILGLLILLSSRQYQSHKSFEKITDQNEKIIFQFATIQEHISECLLERRYAQLKELTTELEALNSNISGILQDPIIPDEYRLSFASQVDLAGVTLLLRSIAAGDQEQAKIHQLNQEVRVLGERLTLFDRVIVNHIKRKLVGFQTAVIGILATVVFVIINILLFWHRQVSLPLFSLTKQVKEVLRGGRSSITPLRKGGEIAELGGLFNNLLLRLEKVSAINTRQNRLQTAALQISETSRHLASREMIFAEVCKAILTNSDYCLIWVGAEDSESRILPVAVNGSTTMSPAEVNDCMNGLLAAAVEKGPEHNAALMATKTRQPVVLRDILEGIPRGTFKNTPFATGYVGCAALPVVCCQRVYGILTVYATAPDCFPEEEVEILRLMAAEMGLACYILDLESNLNRQQLQNRELAASLDQKQAADTMRAAKLAAMGELASDVAHEINNLSNGLINYSQLLSEEIAVARGDAPQLVGLLDNVIKEGERIAQVVQQLLVFNASRAQLVEAVQMDKVIKDVVGLIKHQLNYDGIQARVEFPAALPPVRVNVQKMQLVFLNLLSNARYALNARYSGRSENKRLEIKAETAASAGQQWLKIQLTDWGTGIDPAITKRIFDPFFSTKPEGEGTGLGLSICKALINENRGEIEVASTPNDHTSITVTLPVG